MFNLEFLIAKASGVYVFITCSIWTHPFECVDDLEKSFYRSDATRMHELFLNKVVDSFAPFFQKSNLLTIWDAFRKCFSCTRDAILIDVYLCNLKKFTFESFTNDRLTEKK